MEVVFSASGDTIALSGSKLRTKGSRHLGQHQGCHGAIKFRFETRTHQVAVCCRCNTRIDFPLEVETPEELQEHFRELNQPQLKAVAEASG